MKRSFMALVASVLALAIFPAGAVAGGTSEPADDSGGNCSQSGALVAANCNNISGPQVQVGGGLVNEQNQNNSQQNGDNSGTSNANTDVVAVDSSSDSSDGYEGESQPSGGGDNCNQGGALIAANCNNISAGQYQAGGGVVNQQNQNKFAAVAANCTNLSGGQEQIGGGGRGTYTDSAEPAFVGGGGGSLVNQQNQNNSQQNGNNAGTENENTNVIVLGRSVFGPRPPA